ncbi:hypothetical protein OAT16_05185 [Prolixibacteraceae bacterium]|nr:hypothetical protein [Prolixibacteraceae bacterium]
MNTSSIFHCLGLYDQQISYIGDTVYFNVKTKNGSYVVVVVKDYM